MSRVRILNLPNDCTEEQLKQHLLRTAPREAPLLEITDVQFIRRPATGKDRAHHQHQQQQTKQGGGLAGSGAHRAAPKMILRMAFVGFRTSAAGHFVAQYFNNAFFHSARLRVELAKGLNEVGLTLNQQRKQQLKEEQLLKRASALTSSSSSSKAATSSSLPSAAQTRKRARDGADASAAVAASEQDTTARSAAPATSSGMERRQREFVEQRSKATEGPTWAAEVLLAPDAPPANTSTDATPQGAEDVAEAEEDAVAGQRKAKKKKSPATAGAKSGAAAAVDPVELEQQALSRQQALGEVSDMDFLAGLGGGSSNGGAAPQPHGDADGLAGHSANEEAEGEVSFDDSKDNDDDDDARACEADAPPVKTAKAAKSADASASAAAAALSQEAQEDIARVSHRIRLGNIPYIATEEHLKQFAASLVGPVEAVHIPLTRDTRQNKGAAFVRFVAAEDAVRALQLCRGAILMGRLLRVSAAEEDPHSKRVLEREAALASTGAAAGGAGGPGAGAVSLAGSSQFKKQREADRRAGEAGKNGSGGAGGAAAVAGQITWNTMYMNSHAAVETVAQRLGVRSEDVVGVGAKGAAVRAAIAEAYLTSEVQQVLSDEGIAFDLLEGATQNFLKARSNTTILVKNLQLKDGNDAAELTKLFIRFGVLETSAFPSAGAFALFRYSHPQDARIAFTRLSYKLFKTSPLFLEWAPVGALTEDGEGGSGEATAAAKDLGLSAVASGEDDTAGTATAASAANAVVFTLFLTNVPFQTTEDELHAFLLDACPRLARSPDTLIKRLVLQQEQGRAFLTVADNSTMMYCVSKINGKTLAGRTLSCVVSKQTTQMLEQQQQHGSGAGASGDGAERRHERAGNGVAGGSNDEDDEDADPTKTAVIARRRGEAGAAAATSSSGASSRVPPGCDPLKLIVKNLPFEATEKDVRELCAAFSEIRTVRVPRKSHAFSSHRENNHRGFAFVEFLSEAEAARALETLKATHLYGRHLVLQYAKLDG